jgi:hypothetical protein
VKHAALLMLGCLYENRGDTDPEANYERAWTAARELLNPWRDPALA